MSHATGRTMLVLATAVVILWGWTTADGDQAPRVDRTVPASGEPAIDVLARLEVKGRAAKTSYSREQFGQSWRDTDRNGCDQRNDVLRRDLVDIVLKPGTRGCVVASGSLVSPYSGATVRFERGSITSQQVPIDHVVALSDAWQKGAQQWTAERREAFANDFVVLRATDLSTNSAKSDKDAASWLPPLKSSRCEFIARQIAVKHAWGLWVTRAERDAMQRVLDRCPAQRLPLADDLLPTQRAD